jgi:hypothetical protein
MAPQRRSRLPVLYGILVALVVISGVLLATGQALYGVLVLGIATVLNVRLLALRRKLARRNTGNDRP